MPSLKKANEVYSQFDELNKSNDGYYFHKPFNLEIVTSESHSGIEKALSSTMSRLHKERLETGKGAVIIATHEGFLISNELAQQENKPWHLIWDETTSVIFHIEGNIIKEMKTALFDGIMTIQEENGLWKGEVSEKSIPHLKERLKDQGLIIRESKEFQTITKHLLNAGQGFNDILLGGNIENRISMVFIYNHLKFYGYQSVTFMGANLEMTNLYRWFSMKGIEWKHHEEIYSEVNHVPGEIHQFRLNVHYGTKDQNHSRYFLDKMNDENKPFRDLFREKAMELIGNTPTLLMKNCKDYKLMTKEEFLYPENFKVCPWNMEGLNEYKNLDSAIYIGTFNQHPAYYALIEKLGLEDFTASLHLYQFLMRLACRKWDYRGTINLCIPCLKLFELIKHLFNENMISYIPMDIEFEEKEDERVSLVQPSSEWYEIEDKSKMMKNYGFPKRNSKAEYVKWFAGFGYQSEIIEVEFTTPARQKRVKKHLVVYKTDSALELAKKFFE